MRVLALDLGGRTGWAFGYPRMDKPDSGSWVLGIWPKEGGEEVKRELLLRWYKVLLRKIDKFQPTLLVHEKTVFTEHYFLSHVTEFMQGMIAIIGRIGRDRDIEIRVVDNADWHLAITGFEGDERYKAMSKDERRDVRKAAAKAVCLKRHWKVRHDDEADALCILLYALDKFAPPRPAPRPIQYAFNRNGQGILL